MTSACAASFFWKGDNLAIVTAVPAGQGVEQQGGETVGCEQACGSTGVFEAALMRSLAGDGPYPYQEARQMLEGLGWADGVRLLMKHRPFSLKLNMTYGACPFMPEYVPVEQGANGDWIWLDQLGPAHRTISDRAGFEIPPGQKAVRTPRVSDMSIAIVHQDGEDFPEMAAELRWDLRRRLGDAIIVDRYRGSEFSRDAATRSEMLFDVFRKHRAVMFMGHLAPGLNGSGWMLTDSDVLTMEELRDFLGTGHAQDDSALCVPELVFADCCYSAGHDPNSLADHGLSYPKLFLDAGVRFFVGTSRNLVCTDPHVIQTIALEFLVRWSDDPDGAISHLYEAKKAGGFHLVSGLYQIYAPTDESVVVGTSDQAALAERILAFSHSEGLKPAIDSSTAIGLAAGLCPISWEEATQCLRTCLKRYRVIDERVLTIRDDAREKRFRTVRGLSYCPAAKLPAVDEVGLAPSIEADLSAWVDDVRARKEGSDSLIGRDLRIPPARRVLVRGSSGSGKTSVAENLAARLDRPLVRLDCRSRPSIESALEMIGSLRRCVVLIDDLHRLLQSPAESTPRVEELLLQWLNSLPSGCIVVITVDEATELPSLWQRCMDREFILPSAATDSGQRQAVFAASLRQHGLDSLAADGQFAAELAERSGRYSTHVSSAADIARWVSETISLHGTEGNPTDASFWRSALATPKPGQDSADK